MFMDMLDDDGENKVVEDCLSETCNLSSRMSFLLIFNVYVLWREVVLNRNWATNNKISCK